jgi:predicted nucleotide-binding protein
MAASLKPLRDEFYTWEEYNYEWLKKNIGKAVADETRGSLFIGPPDSIAGKIKWHDENVTTHIRQLQSVIERLPLWMEEPAPTTPGIEVGADAPIFVVHGHNLGLAQEVARVLERATGREAIILHEQANQGQTLIEKFEAHAGTAAFAVVLLTGDDEGRKIGSVDLQPRGRQNVIFELGFFFGMLGRNRVMVLVDEGVEHPSDVSGLVYAVLDPAGAWKQALARELAAAEIAVDRARIP